jgi:cold shock CspA family protein
MPVRFGDYADEQMFEERLKPPPAAPERREHGEIRRWVENGGFGFIVPLGAAKNRDNDVFVHRSLLRAAGIEPAVGMLIDYVVGRGADGRSRVVKIWPAAEIER